MGAVGPSGIERMGQGHRQRVGLCSFFLKERLEAAQVCTTWPLVPGHPGT